MEQKIEYRGVAQFGRALRSGYHTERFGQNLPNCSTPLQTATLSVAQYLRNSGKYRYDHIKTHSYENNRDFVVKI